MALNLPIDKLSFILKCQQNIQEIIFQNPYNFAPADSVSSSSTTQTSASAKEITLLIRK